MHTIELESERVTDIRRARCRVVDFVRAAVGEPCPQVNHPRIVVINSDWSGHYEQIITVAVGQQQWAVVKEVRIQQQSDR